MLLLLPSFFCLLLVILCVHNRCPTQKGADHNHREAPSEWRGRVGYELLTRFSGLEDRSLFVFVSLLMQNPTSDLLRSCIHSPQNVLVPNLLDRDETERVSAKLMIIDWFSQRLRCCSSSTAELYFCFFGFFFYYNSIFSSPVALIQTVIKAENI